MQSKLRFSIPVVVVAVNRHTGSHNAGSRFCRDMQFKSWGVIEQAPVFR